VRNKYQRKNRESNHKFEVVRGQELLVQVPLPIAEVWAERVGSFSCPFSNFYFLVSISEGVFLIAAAIPCVMV
jgi:hypothetical protein